jgi:PAS domain S-box-containing protein
MPRAMADDDVHRNLQFGPFVLSSRERVLRRDGVMLPLGGRALDILIYLAERPGEVIAKQELMDHVWSDVTVEEGSIRVHVAAIRKALGDGQFGNRYIANVKGRGYSFVGIVMPFAGSTESGNDKFSRARFGLRAILPQARSPVVRPALGASLAVEVTLARKGAKSRTRGRKLHGTEAKARVGGARKTRADLEQELKACRREIAHARDRLAEATMQQTATSEMLRLISNSPIQSVLDAIAENAARLCDANNAEIFRLEDNLLRLAASYGEIPVVVYAYQGVPVNRETVTGRAGCDRRTIHVHDLAAEEGEYPVGSSNAKREGHRTTLATPLLREGALIGIILVRRMEVRPFYDEQIALIETFADQAVIAIENVRLYNDLREREARIRRLVDSNIIGIFIGDSRGRIIEANDAFLKMLDYGHDDVISGRMRWTKLTPTEWAPADEDALAQLSGTGTCRPYEKEYYRKDGSRVPVLVGGAFFERKADEGVVFVIDMSDRKRAEEAMRESEAKFSDYAATASDWLWEIGPDYKFTLLTENAFRSDPADRIGTLCWDHAIDLETEPEKWRLVWETLDSRKPFHNFVYCSVDGTGSPMYVKVSGKPVFDANGEFRGYRGTGTDVTAIMRAQQAEASLRTVEAEARESEQRYRKAQLELAHANRVATMGQLTSSIAHEVNQPITAAVTYALAARRWLSAEPPNFHEVDDALSLIVKEGNRAGEVVGRIRALIKKAPGRKDAVAINDAILEVIALTRTEAANNSVSVRTQLAEGLPRVQGDRVQLQQVLLNLIINAIEAMRDIGEKERELLISSRNEPDGVSVEVRDSGPGFAPADIDRVFEAFYTTKPGGLGLGLSICRSIIEAHNGRLWASPNVPRGAIFGFIAPAHPAAAS